MNKRRLVIVTTVGTALLIFAGWFGIARLIGGTEEPTIVLRPNDATVVAKGKSIYAAHCASCHGDTLQGEPNWQQRGDDGMLPAPPHDRSGHTWHHPDEMLFEITKYGPAALLQDPNYRSAMPGYDGVLTDAEIVAALSYIKSEWPKEIQTRHDALNKKVSEK